MKTLTVQWLKPSRKETRTRNMSRDRVCGRLRWVIDEVLASSEEHDEVEVRIRIAKQGRE